MRKSVLGLRQSSLDQFFTRKTSRKRHAPTAFQTSPATAAHQGVRDPLVAQGERKEKHRRRQSTSPVQGKYPRTGSSVSETRTAAGRSAYSSASLPSSSSSSQHRCSSTDDGAPSPHSNTRSTPTPGPYHVFLAPRGIAEMHVANSALPYGCRSVVLPWSPLNVCAGEGGQTCSAWTRIRHILREDTTQTTAGLCDFMQALLVHAPQVNQATSATASFGALAATVDHALTVAERQLFYAQVLPWMKSVACEAPSVFGVRRVPLLRQGMNDRLVLSHTEVLALLCCAFFSLFPGRSQLPDKLAAGHGHGKERSRRNAFGLSDKLAPINFDSLFRDRTGPWRSSLGDADAARIGKIRCLLQYFFTSFVSHADSESHTAVEITRVCYSSVPDFFHSRQPLQHVEMRASGVIEDDTYALQVDFANKVIGGGALGRGCVQEEIRFVVSPELLLARLVCETLCDTEVVLVSGCAQFSAYEGYASSFRFNHPLVPSSVRDPSGGPGERRLVPLRCATIRARGSQQKPLALRDVCVAVMDAVNFRGHGRHPEEQYAALWVNREAVKAFVAFCGTGRSAATLSTARCGPIATGNWGCGAFGGDAELKLVLQWCAASEAGRPLHYYLFDRTDLPPLFAPVFDRLLREGWSVGDTMQAVSHYASYRRDTGGCTLERPLGLLTYLGMAKKEDSSGL